MTEFRVAGVRAGYHTGESLTSKGKLVCGAEGLGSPAGPLRPWRTYVHPSVRLSVCPMRRARQNIGFPFQKTSVMDSFPQIRVKALGVATNDLTSGQCLKMHLRGGETVTQRREKGMHMALLLGRKNLHNCQLQGFSFLVLTKGKMRATIFFSYILTCDFSVPECINSRGLFNY